MPFILPDALTEKRKWRGSMINYLGRRQLRSDLSVRRSRHVGVPASDRKFLGFAASSGTQRARDLLIRRYLCGHPLLFRSVRDLGPFLVRYSCRSGEPEGRSSVWLPAWLPRNRARPALSVGCNPRQREGATVSPAAPAERDSRWALSVRFAIEAASRAEARVIIGQTLASLDRELSLHGEPAIVPVRLRPRIWAATAELDVRPVEPDDPENHCRYVAHHFGVGVTWTSCRFAITRTRRWHWRPGTRSSDPGGNGVLVHPALRAVRISCEAK